MSESVLTAALKESVEKLELLLNGTLPELQKECLDAKTVVEVALLTIETQDARIYRLSEHIQQMEQERQHVNLQLDQLKRETAVHWELKPELDPRPPNQASQSLLNSIERLAESSEKDARELQQASERIQRSNISQVSSLLRNSSEALGK